MQKHLIEVSIIYAERDQSWRKQISIPRGSTPVDLINASGLLGEFPNLGELFTADKLVYGIYSQKVSRHHLLQSGDRLEIYRPLLADPKEVRRELAKQGKTMAGNSN